MIRTVALPVVLALALGSPGAAAPAHKPVAGPAAPRDWLTVVAATPEGGFRLGNPAAPVKLVEYGSLTCPHCKAFEDEGGAQLRSEYIAKGLVSYEYRSFVLNSADYAAAVLARCDGPPAFFSRVQYFYKTQIDWTKPFYELGRDRILELATLPPPRAIAETARAIGLDKRLRGDGWAAAHLDRCLADRVAIDRLAVIRAAAQDANVNGTPGFFINGKLQTGDYLGTQQQIVRWADVEPRLAAALRGRVPGGKVGR